MFRIEFSEWAYPSAATRHLPYLRGGVGGCTNSPSKIEGDGARFARAEGIGLVEGEARAAKRSQEPERRGSMNLASNEGPDQ